MLRRSKFRDYSDIYSLLKSDRFLPDSAFSSLDPIYDITPKEIEEAIIENLKKSRKYNK